MTAASSSAGKATGNLAWRYAEAFASKKRAQQLNGGAGASTLPSPWSALNMTCTHSHASRALPRDWTPTQVFFAITVILSLIGWTTLGREVRGRFLALREEDFVLAAELAGCSRARIILRHMVPTFLSHIIATSSLAIPVMIINETSLSFLGLGIRPPAISWGVLLQEAQNIQTLALAPWLLLPGLLVIVAVLAFNLVGDGLRDASDPYSK